MLALLCCCNRCLSLNITISIDQMISFILSFSEIKDLHFEYVPNGVKVYWNGTGSRAVRYSQNLTQAMEKWSSVNVTGNYVEVNSLSIRTKVDVVPTSKFMNI